MTTVEFFGISYIVFIAIIAVLIGLAIYALILGITFLRLLIAELKRAQQTQSDLEQ